MSDKFVDDLKKVQLIIDPNGKDAYLLVDDTNVMISVTIGERMLDYSPKALNQYKEEFPENACVFSGSIKIDNLRCELIKDEKFISDIKKDKIEEKQATLFDIGTKKLKEETVIPVCDICGGPNGNPCEKCLLAYTDKKHDQVKDTKTSNKQQPATFAEMHAPATGLSRSRAKDYWKRMRDGHPAWFDQGGNYIGYQFRDDYVPPEERVKDIKRVDEPKHSKEHIWMETFGEGNTPGLLTKTVKGCMMALPKDGVLHPFCTPAEQFKEQLTIITKDREMAVKILEELSTVQEYAEQANELSIYNVEDLNIEPGKDGWKALYVTNVTTFLQAWSKQNVPLG